MTQAEIDGASFSMTFYGRGYSSPIDPIVARDPKASKTLKPDQKIVTRVSGPGNERHSIRLNDTNLPP